MGTLRQREKSVLENNATTIRFELFDEDEDPSTPDSAEYRVDDPLDGRAIIGWTAVGSPTDTIDIEVTGEQNALDLAGDGQTDEQREITLKAMYSGEPFYVVRYYNVEAMEFA